MATDNSPATMSEPYPTSIEKNLLTEEQMKLLEDTARNEEKARKLEKVIDELLWSRDVRGYLADGWDKAKTQIKEQVHRGEERQQWLDENYYERQIAKDEAEREEAEKERRAWGKLHRMDPSMTPLLKELFSKALLRSSPEQILQTGWMGYLWQERWSVPKWIPTISVSSIGSSMKVRLQSKRSALEIGKVYVSLQTNRLNSTMLTKT